MWLYRLGKFLTSIPLRLAGIRVLGRENIPQDQPFIIVANHTSLGDPLALTYAFKQPVTYIGKEAFAKNPLTRCIFGACGTLFLKEDESDLTAMRQSIGLLKQGRVIAIFPEGRRNFDQVIGEFKPGAAYIAYRAAVPVLPISIINAGDYWRFWRRNIIVNIGQPIHVPNQGQLDKDSLALYNDVLEQSVRGLFAASQVIIANEGKKMRS
jgi:1-acyl-sn-glycerol-3-phosphate acyltransferase